VRKKYSADEEPLVPAEKLSRKRTLLGLCQKKGAARVANAHVLF
jgi:hypothetical protein